MEDAEADDVRELARRFEAGSVVDHVAYDSYGNILSETSPASGDRFKFAGRNNPQEPRQRRGFRNHSCVNLGGQVQIETSIRVEREPHTSLENCLGRAAYRDAT
jgi:hypothetical protein